MQLKQVDLVYERQWSSLNNLVGALREMGCMGRLYGGFPRFRYEKAGIPREIIRSFPLASLWNFAARRVKLPEALLLDEPRWLGNRVARHSDLAPVVMANGTAHRFLFPKLKETGRTLILERGSMHPLDYFHFPQRARREAGYPYSESLPAALQDEIEKNALADYVIAGSEMIRESYVTRGFPAARVFTCRYGIDTQRVAFIRREPPARRPIRVAAIGVIGFRKGLHRLLRLGEWAKRRGIPLEIHFAGPIEDPEAQEMLAGSSATTHLHGVVKGAAMTEFLKQADFCATLSYEEGLPFALLEGMATGLPALVSTDTGAREVPTDGHEGIHLTHFTDDEFDSKLGDLLRAPDEILRMGSLARAKIESGFTRERYAADLRSILETISGKR
jgi:alpha-maltose-1-phosphate synthase